MASLCVSAPLTVVSAPRTAAAGRSPLAVPAMRPLAAVSARQASRPAFSWTMRKNSKQNPPTIYIVVPRALPTSATTTRAVSHPLLERLRDSQARGCGRSSIPRSSSRYPNKCVLSTPRAPPERPPTLPGRRSPSRPRRPTDAPPPPFSPQAPALTPALAAASPVSRRSVAASAGKLIQVEINRPLGLKLKQGPNGLTVAGSSGNAAAAGISKGDTVVFTSSFFGDELWPSDRLGFTNSALAAAPEPVFIEFVEGANTDYDGEEGRETYLSLPLTPYLGLSPSVSLSVCLYFHQLSFPFLSLPFFHAPSPAPKPLLPSPPFPPHCSQGAQAEVHPEAFWPHSVGQGQAVRHPRLHRLWLHLRRPQRPL